jgi:hypothetical protein
MTGVHTPETCPLAAELKSEQGRREVAKWVLGVAVTIAIAIGGWAHTRLAADADRLTRLETQRDGDRQALDTRLSDITRRLDELRDLVRGRP